MDRAIAYPEKDLVNRFKYLASCISNIESMLNMIEEQAMGFRDNLDWKSTAATLRTNFEKIKGTLNEFNIEKLPTNNLLEQDFRMFDDYHLKIIQDRFLERVAKSVDDIGY
jgi:hypothetical protein